MPSAANLQIRDLNVFYGQSHALQGVSLSLDHGVLSVVGRNGMGKTTLCKAIMGLEPIASGTVTLDGQALNGRNPAEIARMGIGYVPQGRRLWRTLTVDEHLRLVEKRGGAWTIERIYATFPRLAERRGNDGGQLSGGEQQMLAISRALLLNPRLLVMDEPTEGLAPVIVRQVEGMLVRLVEENDVDVLVIEQNTGVACAVAEQVAIMVNGRINRVMASSLLAGDRDLQQALLGVGRHAHDETPAASGPARPANRDAEAKAARGPARIYVSNPAPPTRWSRPAPVRVIEASARTVTEAPRPADGALAPFAAARARNGGSRVLLAGTLDTKGDELRFIRDILKDELEDEGLAVQLVDLSTSGKPSGAEVPPHAVAALHPRGVPGVFTGDRGTAMAGMTLAFERWIAGQDGIAGIMSAGGSGATALTTPAMRSLPVGIPKVMISTVASGNTERYVGSSDILMLNSVADVQGLNAITRAILANGAHALAGMVRSSKAGRTAAPDRPAIGLTMFGVTTPCVQMVSRALADEFDCLVFHATGTGVRAMEKLLDSGKLAGVVDLTTTDVCDMMMGGVFAADDDRFGAAIRSSLPYVGACGALDMVNFNAPDTVPDRYRGRTLYEHNPQITLMRTTPEENDRMGRWIGERLNRMTGPVRFFLPEGGVSLLDAPGQPFHDPAADAALFGALEATVNQTSARRLVRTPHNINDAEFASLVVQAFRALHGEPRARASGG